jgi:hypothetical protein
MDRGRVGDERGSKETDGCPLTPPIQPDQPTPPVQPSQPPLSQTTAYLDSTCASWTQADATLF